MACTKVCFCLYYNDTLFEALRSYFVEIHAIQIPSNWPSQSFIRSAVCPSVCSVTRLIVDRMFPAKQLSVSMEYVKWWSDKIPRPARTLLSLAQQLEHLPFPLEDCAERLLLIKKKRNSVSATTLQSYTHVGGSCHRYNFCRDKSFVVTNIFLPWQYFCRDKYLSRQT